MQLCTNSIEREEGYPMKYVRRFLLDKLEESIKNNRIIIILGSRQVGKTTLMEMLQASIPSKYQKYYFNLEDIKHLDICQNIDTLKTYLKSEGMDIEKQHIFITIDEFQYIKNATKLLKTIYDLYPLTKAVVSGSSSLEIQKHLKESLAGRKRIYTLYSLSFEEYIRFRSERLYSDYENIKLNKNKMSFTEANNKGYFKEYLTYGGYPKIALVKGRINKIEELQDIYNSYIQKDVKSLIKGEHISAFNNLVKILASQIGNLVNTYELSNTLSIDRRQTSKYLDILEETFVIKLLKPFHSNKRAEISKMPKLYFLDSGITNFSIGNFSDIDQRQNLGSYVENFIFNEITRYKPLFYNVYFWRTKVGTEIDFILEGNNELIPIEVKWQNIKCPFIPRSFTSFFENHKNTKRAVVITKTHYAEMKNKGVSVYFIPAIFFNKFMKRLSKP